MSCVEPMNEPVKVLIVEDEVLVSLHLSDIIEDAGYVVEGVADRQEEAFRLARRCGNGVAIVDVNLNGDEIGVKVAKELQDRHGMFLIFISGFNDVADLPEVRALTPTAILQKPYRNDEIINAIKMAAAVATTAKDVGD